MEPIEVMGFHGFHVGGASAGPEAGRFDVVTAAASGTEELVALGLERLSHLTRAELAWPLEASEVFEWLLIEKALDRRGALLGYGHAGHAHFAPQGRAMLQVVVAQAHEGRGVGSALRSSLLRRLPEGTTSLAARTFDQDPRSLEIARHWGFRVEEHAIDSELDLSHLPTPEPPPGVTLQEAHDLVFTDREAVEHMLLVSQTNPEARLGWLFDLDRLASTVTSTEQPVCVVVRVDGRPAGLTFGSVTDGQLFIVYSGIDPAFRGRGLMMLAKQQAHLSAARLGATVSKTNNEEHNHGIRRVNAALGYRVTSGAYRLALDLSG